jgi:hypothetical protein
MTTTARSAALVPAAPVFTNTERLALTGFLADPSGDPPARFSGGAGLFAHGSNGVNRQPLTWHVPGEDGGMDTERFLAAACELLAGALDR